jgi:hypothetical protein
MQKTFSRCKVLTYGNLYAYQGLVLLRSLLQVPNMRFSVISQSSESTEEKQEPSYKGPQLLSESFQFQMHWGRFVTIAHYAAIRSAVPQYKHLCSSFLKIWRIKRCIIMTIHQGWWKPDVALQVMRNPPQIKKRETF